MDTWNNAYELWVDGKKTKIELIGTSKTKAYEGFLDQWWLYYHGSVPAPSKRRCRLVYIESVRNN